MILRYVLLCPFYSCYDKLSNSFNTLFLSRILNTAYYKKIIIYYEMYNYNIIFNI